MNSREFRAKFLQIWLRKCRDRTKSSVGASPSHGAVDGDIYEFSP